VLAEAKPAVHGAAHVEEKNHPVGIHLLQEALVKLADPGVGVAHRIQLFNKGQVLVGHVAGYPHLADGVHAQTDRIRFHDLLHIGPFGFRYADVGQFFELIDGFDRYEFIAREQNL
jgi:hypothetical protein